MTTKPPVAIAVIPLERGETLEIAAYVVLALLIVAVLYVVFTYNNLVSLKHAVAKAWSNIDVLLKQRHDELPKLVEVCRQYMKFEQDTLTQVMEARSQVFDARNNQDIGALGQAEGMLRVGLGNLFAVAEAYPDLTANEHFRHLQTRVSGLENAIADRREYYNESVNVNNVRIDQFPDIVVAKLFSFPPFELLEFSDEERRDVNLKALFG